MFIYEEYKIISAAPIARVREYLLELGAVEITKQKYEYNGLEIELTAYDDDKYPDLGIPRHTITVDGDPTLAEDFLTAFRLRFLSVGG